MADDLSSTSDNSDSVVEVLEEDEKKQEPQEPQEEEDPEFRALLAAAPHEKINGNAATAAVMTRSCISSLIVGGLVGVVVLSALSASPNSSSSGFTLEPMHDTPQADQQILPGQSDILNSSVVVEEGVYDKQLNPPGTCILDQSKLPREWMPPSRLSFQDSGETWTKEEQQLADYASQKGLDELVDFYDSISDMRIMHLFTNAANSVIDQCFASANRPNFHDKACKSASRLVQKIATHFTKGFMPAKCKEMKNKSKLLAYAQYLSVVLPGDSKLKDTRNELVDMFRTSFQKCSDLDEYLNVSKERWEANLDLNNLSLSRETLKNYIHQQGLINLYTIPEFDVPEEVDRYIARIWKFVAKYKYINGVDSEQGYADGETRHHGYLLTHIAYWPTGYGRHVQLVDDAPWLYEVCRYKICVLIFIRMQAFISL